MNPADPDPFHLRRFVDAQNDIYADVIEELKRGAKRSHWMWYVFPQIRGLGSSATAKLYAISSMAEANAYLLHPVLGPRLRECTALTLGLQDKAVEQIFPFPDHLKFHSSMTLFASAAADNDDFSNALKKYFGGNSDQATLRLLSSS